eukprot:2715184-Rhodomonas_salina.1
MSSVRRFSLKVLCQTEQRTPNTKGSVSTLRTRERQVWLAQPGRTALPPSPLLPGLGGCHPSPTPA